MAKKIIYESGRTFNEFSLLTGHTGKECVPQNITLRTKLADNISLKVPLISSPMTSVTGYEMALAIGRNGGMGILPARLDIATQAEIVSKIKSHELSFVDEPLTIRDNQTVEEALSMVSRHGYSTIPVVTRFGEFLGIFTMEHYWKMDIPQSEMVDKVMIRYNGNDSNMGICDIPDITVSEAKGILKNTDAKYLVVLDEQKRLIKMAFKQDTDMIPVGIATDTYDGWKDRVQANIKAGADLVVIDTSDAYNEYIIEAIKEYKKSFSVPLCAGNVITYEGAMALMEAGVDMIKEGMSSGSICTTQKVKATGRGPMTSLLETARARDDYFRKTGKYVPVIADGGISSSADMIIALAAGADVLMMGNYFNKFYESAAPKLDENRKQTNDELKMRYVETWGEGSERAKNLGRYGHSNRKTFFAEGVEGVIPYAGRLKPNVERDAQIIKTALSNVGAMNLKEFRENSVLELNSMHTSTIVSTTHHLL